jgi:inosine-uridine nucleoside N-ribohydrolase
MPERVIIDTDPGIDDALALLLAFRSPEIEIAAITTVSGNVPVKVATRNVFTILSLLRPDRRPLVAVGASKPLEKDSIFATAVHGRDGLGGFDRRYDTSGRPRYTAPLGTPSHRTAVEEILFHLSSSPHALTLIALGPLTNVAQAIEMDRTAMATLKRVVLMGGAFTVPGNVTPVAEFNIYVDPHAARIVFDAGIPLTVVGLDVTRRVRLTRKTLETEIVPCETTISQFVCDATSDLFAMVREEEGTRLGVPLHDPLAVGAVIDPSFVASEAMHVEIERTGEFTEGMTVADRRSIRADLKKPPNADVCVDVDASRFLSFFLERLCEESSSSGVSTRT